MAFQQVAKIVSRTLVLKMVMHLKGQARKGLGCFQWITLEGRQSKEVERVKI
ncbi:hypothetical protein REPUB_Repub08aG0112000 [Reevesia pubescens]